MKKYKHYFFVSIMLFNLFLLSNCKKQDAFLDTKPNIALAIPSTINDLQLLIQDESVFNRQGTPALGEISSDDYFNASYNSLKTATEQNAYIWAKVVYASGANVADWTNPYSQIYYANTILEYLPKVSYASAQQVEYNTINGSALFFRAVAFYNLVQTFAMPYDPKTSSTDLGIPLRLSSDLNIKSVRSSVQACYTQIIQDLNSSADLLPSLPGVKTLPSKTAAYGMLSRVYLVTGDYANALKYATNFLNAMNILQDFNKLNPNAFPVYPNYSPEDIYHCSLIGYGILGFTAQVDSTLYKSFDNPNDLRPKIFFYNDKGKLEFNSQFDKKNDIYTGISTNEILLNKAECEARLGDFKQAMTDLNILLISRWKTGTFIPYQAISADDALAQILRERRKELVMTGLRWSDLRRLNKDGRYAITLKRFVNGVIYTLPPNDPRYALPIPDPEITLSGIPQNIR